MDKKAANISQVHSTPGTKPYAHCAGVCFQEAYFDMTLRKGTRTIDFIARHDYQPQYDNVDICMSTNAQKNNYSTFYQANSFKY